MKKGQKKPKGSLLTGESKTARIALGRGFFTIIDEEDLPKLSLHRWFVTKKANAKYYVQRTNGPGGKTILMHREIMKAKEGQMIDHINGDSLDNRKANLRFATAAQNAQNSKKRMKNASSKYKGVYWNKGADKWRATIMSVSGKSIHIGYFESEIDAAKAYDEKAKELFGKFARLNFPDAAQKQVTNERVLCVQGTSDTPWLF